ncbi:PLP-dependent aminotransferase family protein [Arthrobacter sp. G.S.26]|uniref:MocR-like transcription factor YczR n=1 Tax=Arthrobacter sp. G.S.26 TaxID=3433706 RepID=UPI003D77B4E6
MPGAMNPAALARLMGPWQSAAGPAYRELADVVRLLVLDGRLPLDTPLPSERSLSETLGMSRTTVTAAYALLREQGFLSSGQGAKGRTRLPRSAAGVAAPGMSAPDGLLDLAYASLPASGEVVHRAFSAALNDLPALLPGFGYEVLGLPVLREAVAARYTAAGVPTTADQILITSGAQHALNIILRAEAGPRHGRPAKVLVEHPSYPNALDAIAGSGARALPVAVGGPGQPHWDLDAVEATLQQHRPAVAYLVPDFHNPTGKLMPDPQRRRLVRAAAAAGTVLVIDETLRDLNLNGLDSQHVAAFGSCVSVGSLSKSHWAGLRTGWIRAGREQIRRYAAQRTTLDLGGPLTEQLAAAHLMAHFEEPLPARLAALRDQRGTLQELLAEHLPTWQAAAPDGGLTLWCRLPAPISTALTVIAPGFGVRLAAGPRFGVGGAFEHYVRIPYTLDPGSLETAVRALRSAQNRLEAAPQLRRALPEPPRVAIA